MLFFLLQFFEYVRSLCNRPRRLPAITIERLSECVEPGRIYISVSGRIFDVSGDDFLYGCNGPYSMFAGHDISLILARRQYDATLLNSDISDLSQAERDTLQQFLLEFSGKYRQVARLSEPITHRHPAVPGIIPIPICSYLPRVFTPETLFDSVKLRGDQYIAVKGIVYDVSTDTDRFRDGIFAFMLGHDASVVFAKQTMDKSLLDNRIDFGFDEMCRLESVVDYFRHLFACVGVLQNCPTARYAQGSLPSIGANNDIHHAIDIGDIALAKKLISNGTDVNQLCTRTSMTPLQKAVERDVSELVQDLLNAGADPSIRCQLYDNETALQMAYRFGLGECISVLSPPAG